MKVPAIGPGERADAADHHVEQRVERHLDVRRLGSEEADEARKQTAGEAGDRRRHRERHALGGHHVDAHRRGQRFALANRHRACGQSASARRRDTAARVSARKNNARYERAMLESKCDRAKRPGPRNADDADVPVRQRFPFLDHEVDDEPDREREDGEVVALAAQADRSDRIADAALQSNARPAAQPERDAGFRGEQRHRVGADAEEARMRQRQLSREARR